MKTKKVIFSIFIASLFALIFGGRTYAVAGNTVEISGGKTWNVCVSDGASYDGSVSVINISKSGFATQLALGNNECKTVALEAGSYAASLSSAIGAGTASYDISDNTLTFSANGGVRKYLNAFGSIAYTVEGSGEESQFELLFSMPGECQFNGNANVSGDTCKDGDGSPLTNKKYIDTNVALFSEENAGRDFEVYFTLTDYATTQAQQGTLFNAKYENSSMYYPGFVIRTVGTNGETMEITGRLGKDNTNADKANNSITTADIKNKEVKIVRVGGMVSYSIDGGEMIPFQDYKNFTRYFEQTAVFGASMQTNGTPQRYYNGTIKNIRVYLKKVTTAKIIFDANGGTGTMAAIKDIEVGTNVTLPANTFAKEDAAFDGWNTKADGTGTTYADEATVAISAAGELKLYAQWRALAKITFDVNGGTGTMAAIENIEVGTSVVLPANTFTRLNAEFDGWNTKADGTGTAYADEATVLVSAAETVRLYAQWDGKAVLDSGENVNTKLTRLASKKTKIKSIKAADALPVGFNTSNTENKISASATISPKPIYAWFDNNDNDGDGEEDGIIYVFTTADEIEAGADMSGMFASMSNLADISALASWNTSNATNMSGIFSGSNSLTSLSALASWDTSNVTNMSNLLSGIGYRTDLSDISALANWDTSNVTDMSRMFIFATSILDISALASWDTSSVTDMNNMFCGMKLTNLDALESTQQQRDGKNYVSWDVSNVTDMNYMFSSMTSLTDISALASWDTSSVVDMSSMFTGTDSLSDISALASWDLSSAENISGMFAYDYALADISALASWNTSNVKDMNNLFYLDSLITDISALASWNTSNVTKMYYMFAGTKVTSLDALETKKHDGKDYVSWDTSSVELMSDMFSTMSSLTDISALASWDTSSVTTMAWMFDGDWAITDISPLRGWDVSNVTNMTYMFSSAKGITDLSPLGGWNVSNSTNMKNMFRYVPATPPSWYHE